MTQWYFHSTAQPDRVGPLDDEAARQYARSNPRALVWCEGMSGWMAIGEVPELLASTAVPTGAPPPLPGAGGRSQRADDIEFRIVGHEMQFVEIELDPGESAIAEAGALMFKDASVQMDTVFGDGSHSGQGGGLMDKLMSAGKRVLTGESLFATLYTHTGQGKAKVA
ncbi:AIM24 family protein, partial [Stenotrophomonas sp.]